MTRVGFIGLGSQGGPMARAIVEAGFPTTLWARRPESLQPYADTAASYADTPAALGAASDVVCLCVIGDDDVRGLAYGDDGLLAAMAEGSTLVIHSTIHPDTCRELAERAEAKGISVLDAPVSGGGGAAAAGNLLVMVGGDEAALVRIRPVLESFADPIVHLGPVGAGQITKILNNLLFSANLGAAISMLELGEQLGVPRDKACQVMTNGSANSKALGSISAFGGTLKSLAPIAGALLQKDVRLAASLADAAGVEQGKVFNAADAALDAMGHPR